MKPQLITEFHKTLAKSENEKFQTLINEISSDIKGIDTNFESLDFYPIDISSLRNVGKLDDFIKINENLYEMEKALTLAIRYLNEIQSLLAR